MNALPTSFAIVSGHPQVWGAYGRPSGVYRALTAVRAFLVAGTRGYSLAVVCSPLTAGLLLQGAGSGCTGFSRRGSQAQLPHSVQELPGPEIEPGSPVLAGG